jgi:hypothetical protein
MWTWRLAALLVAVVIPACGGSGSRPASTTGIQWNSQASSGANVGGPVYSGTSLWVDPNSGLGGGQIGITQLITSQDLTTYARYNISSKPPPFNTFISYIFALEHPLATDTSSGALTQRESELEGLINGFRGTSNPVVALSLPNVGGGGGGLGGIGGMGGNVGGGSALPSHLKGTTCARAHCKHYAYFHPGFPGNVPGGNTYGTIIYPGPTYFDSAQPNFEGDYLLQVFPGSPADVAGTPAPGNPYSRAYGRLGKIGVRANKNGWCEYSVAGPSFKESLDVYPELLVWDPDILLFVNWTNMCVGHWIGGPLAYYWNIIFIIFPNPAF